MRVTDCIVMRSAPNRQVGCVGVAKAPHSVKAVTGADAAK